LRSARLTTPVLALTVLLAACGGTSKSPTPVANTPPAATSTPAADLAPLLVANGVLPGFKRTGADPVQENDAEAWAATNQEPDSSQLKALGFVAGAREDLVGPGAYALNLVERFRTADDAHKRLTYTARDFGSKKGRFRVSGVPGAVGFESGSGSKLGRSVAFSKGDTVFLLSHQVSKTTPSVEQLKDAIRKWYAAVPG
jgi:hypothetical protein